MRHPPSGVPQYRVSAAAPGDRPARAAAGTLVALMLSLGVVACGGSSLSSSSTHSAATATSTPRTTATTPAGGGSSVTTGPVRGTLLAVNHAPRVNVSWPYSVRVADAAGHPLSGTVDIEFVFGGSVVGRDTPPTHPLHNGRWQDNLKFPAAAVGALLTFRAVVHTHAGSIVLDWRVTVGK